MNKVEVPFCPATMCPLFAVEGSPWTGEKNAHCGGDTCGWFHRGHCEAQRGAEEQIAEFLVGGQPLIIAATPKRERMRPKPAPDCPRAHECQWQIEAGDDLCPPRKAVAAGVDPRMCAY